MTDLKNIECEIGEDWETVCVDDYIWDETKSRVLELENRFKSIKSIDFKMKRIQLQEQYNEIKDIFGLHNNFYVVYLEVGINEAEYIGDVLRTNERIIDAMDDICDNNWEWDVKFKIS